MSYAKDREAFVFRMAQEGATLGTIRMWLHYAGILQRAAEVDCSVSDPAIRERAGLAAKRAVDQAFTGAPMPGWICHVEGDPRGYVVKFYKPGMNPDTGIGIGVPAKGYRASQLSRMAR